MNNSAILRQPAPLGTIPTWKVQIQAAKRAEAKRRQNLSKLPDMKFKRDSELASLQGIVKESKDGIETESVQIDLSEFGDVDEYPEY